MKIKNFAYAIALLGTSIVTLAGCNNNEDQKEFSFTVALKSGKNTLETGEVDEIVIYTNGVDDQDRVYTYSSNIEDRATVDESGYVTAGSQNGQVTITVKETNSNKTQKVVFSVTTPSEIANGGFNYAAAAGTDAIAKRTEILGRLEKYAIDTHLTGITLFENGGYVKYNPRITIPATEYITGYGFGILSEGKITGDLKDKSGNPTDTSYTREYYHSAQTNNPNKINAWNETGSQVSDLASYITGSYWGTKMNATKDGYVWYPMLAADTVDGKANNRPVPVYDTVNPLGLYKTWKIYVKTDANMGAKGLKYHYVDSSFDGRGVTLDDYKFAYQVLLTGANKQTRGAEMAGDKSYGIKGAQAYYNRTKDMTDQAQIDDTWNQMTLSNASTGAQDASRFNEQQLGIMTGSDSKGDYIQLELINEIDEFTAMYNLSSSLVSPMPRAFIESLANSGKVIDGVLAYGQASNNRNIVQNTISLGAYHLKEWKDEYIAFERSDDWFEVSSSRYLIKGVKITTFDNATQEQLYQYYDTGLIDSCGLPISHIKSDSADPDVKVTKGDSTFKLNINSCTSDRWLELFGNNGSIFKNDPAQYWTVKPWMSNDNFLKGLYWAINREEFASNRGVTPSINYFADAYLSDPENGISYNSTEEHKKAVSSYHTVRTVDGKEVDNYGYDYSKAVNYFKLAVQQLAKKGDITYGTPSSPKTIHMNITWMYQTDTTEYGNDIVKYIQDAFNDPAVCGGRVKLVVDQDAVTNWEDVYNEVMMKGKFDLAFGAISGNTYSPLNFLEVLKSDNSSGFTLNWGPDTGKVDETNPLVFDGKKWAFDALWEVADRGGVVEQGSIVKTCKNYYFDGMFKDLTSGADTNTLKNGANLSVNLDFVDLDSVKIEVNKVQVYVVGGSNTDVTSYSYNKDTKKLSINISSELGATLNEELNSIVNKNKNVGDEGYINDPLARSRYNSLYTIEVYYTLSIKKNNEWGTPSQQFVTVALTKEDQGK